MRPETLVMEPPADAAEPAGNGRGEPSGLPACTLERLIGRPRATWTVDDLVEVVRARDIRLVSLMHVGGDGWLKTLDFAPRDAGHLRDILTGGERADGSSLFAGLGIQPGRSDIVLRPRPQGAFLDPFAPLPTLALLSGHAGRDGEPLPQSPDTLVRRAAQRLLERTGVTLAAHGEVEFFLGRHSEEKDMYGAADRGYHAASPFVFGESLRRRALGLLAEMGVPVKYGHSEVGYVEAGETAGLLLEQHEIELALAPLPEAADHVVLTQWVLRNLAHGDGLRCSFEPILLRGHAGNGLHVHLAPARDGRPEGGRLEDGTLPPPARWLIAGLTRHGAALMAFGNRGAGSFVRLAQAKEAPSAIRWGEYDRGALVRLPIAPRDPDGRLVSPATVEFRLPDGSAHPHLLMAGIAQVMVEARGMTDLDGWIERVHSAPAESAGAAPVPRTFAEVAMALQAARGVLEAGGVFPGVLIDRLLETLRS